MSTESPRSSARGFRVHTFEAEGATVVVRDKESKAFPALGNELGPGNLEFLFAKDGLHACTKIGHADETCANGKLDLFHVMQFTAYSCRHQRHGQRRARWRESGQFQKAGGSVLISTAKNWNAARSSAERDAKAARLFKAPRAACSGVHSRSNTASRKYRSCWSVASEAPAYLST